jgi:phosphate starvation-inducible protein PhoH
VSKQAKKNKNPQNFSIRAIKPITENQSLAFQQFQQMDKHLMLHGLAGTGKTFCALYLALMEVAKGDLYDKVIIVRSTVPSRDMGFLPGSPEAKAKVYEVPYYEIVGDLYGRGDAYDVCKNKGMIEFITTSHLRGVTLRNAIVVVDEYSNMEFGELDTIITRIGVDCRLIFCGDIRQSDLKKDKERAGVLTFMDIIATIGSFSFIEFGVDDIVRSDLVKSYIIAKMNKGMI